MFRRIWVWVGHFSTLVWLWSLVGAFVTAFIGSVVGDLTGSQLALLGGSAFFSILAVAGTWGGREQRSVGQPGVDGSRPRTAPPGSWLDPEELRAYVQRINQVMEEEGFPNPNLQTPTKQAEPLPVVAGRVFITATPERLTGFYRDHLAIQARTLIKPYLGKWMTVSGPLENVDPHWTGGGASVTLAYRPGVGSIFMNFTDEELVDRLSTMERGQEITVIGRIETIEEHFLTLNDCELL